MRTPRIFLIAAALLAIPALVAAAPPASQGPSPGATLAAAPAAAPALDAFLASLSDPAAMPVSRAGNSCGANFCTQAQRDACNQQCLQHHHGTFVGLECCSNCTTLCICGSVPVDC